MLINVVKRDGFDYENVFTEGTLSFKARKGGRSLEAKDFEITSTTTVQELTDFMENALGIQTASTDSENPIPSSINTITGEAGTILPGAYIRNGQLRFVSNNGLDNAVDIDLTSFRITDDNGVVTTPNLAFGSAQKAAGQSAVADFVAYDPHSAFRFECALRLF